MIGKNPLWCSRQHGHSVQVMYERYGTWIEGATQADIEAIQHAMAAEATATQIDGPAVPAGPRPSPKLVGDWSVEGGWGRLSWRKVKHFNSLTGGADGTRTRPESNEISNLLYPKEGESPFDPYDPRISHQISHYLGKPSPRSAYPESRRPSPKHSLM
jgi:hypothetical protein